MARGERLLNTALTLAMAGGCTPGHAEAPVPPQEPADVRVLLDCPSGSSGNHQAILTGLQPGQRVIIQNRSTEGGVEIDVRDGGAYAVWGANPRVRQDGEIFAATGNPYEPQTVVRVVAGEPEFIGYTPTWHSAASAITAFCASHPLRSPTGYTVPVGATQG